MGILGKSSKDKANKIELLYDPTDDINALVESFEGEGTPKKNEKIEEVNIAEVFEDIKNITTAESSETAKENTTRTLANLFKGIRSLKKLTQDELAKSIFTSRVNVNKIENGKARGQDELLDRTVDTYGEEIKKLTKSK